MTPHALHAHVDWQQWLRLFQLPTTSATLPTQTECPICRGTNMLLFADRVSYGQWGWCRKCGLAGNLLHLAGQVWDLSPADTVQKLVQNGFRIPFSIEALELYSRHVTRPMRTFRRLWKASQRRLSKSSTTFRNRVQQLSGCYVGNAAEFEAKFRDILGCAASADIESAIGKSRGGRRLFPGKNWHELLVVPRWHLPGQLAGFNFVGRSWGGKADQPAWHHDDPGLAMPSDLFAGSLTQRRTIVATQSLRTYLKLQCRSRLLDYTAAPLVHWIPTNKVTAAWDAVRPTSIVLWERRVTAAGIAAAYAMNCRISTAAEITDKQPRPVQEILENVISESRPWHEIVSRLTKQLPDDAFLGLLTSLVSRGVDVMQMLTSCGTGARRRAAAALGDSYNHRSVVVNRRTVVERDGRWYFEERKRSPELICDAVLRIDRVIHRKQRNETLCQGRILYGGREVEFCCPKAQIDRDALTWMSEELLRQNLGVLYVNPSWRKFGAAIATQLQKPVLLQGADYVGWDADRRSLVLPQFELPFGCEPRTHEGGFRPEDPGFALAPPEALAGNELACLGNVATQRAMLAGIGCVAAAAMAPIVHQPLPRLMLSGSGAGDLLKILANACGMPYLRIDRTTKFEQATAVAQTHAWPFAVDHTRCPTKSVAKWMVDNETSGVFTSVGVGSHDAALLGGNWYAIDASHATQPPPDAEQAITRLLTNYLAVSLRQQLPLQASVDWLETVLDDFQLFVEQTQPGDGVGPLTGRGGLLWIPDAPRLAKLFASSLYRLRGRGLVSINNDCRASLRLTQTMRDGVSIITVPKVGYMAAVHTTWGVSLSAFRLTAALAETQPTGLIEDSPDAWVLSADWFSSAAPSVKNTTPR